MGWFGLCLKSVILKSNEEDRLSHKWGFPQDFLTQHLTGQLLHRWRRNVHLHSRQPIALETWSNGQSFWSLTLVECAARNINHWDYNLIRKSRALLLLWQKYMCLICEPSGYCSLWKGKQSKVWDEKFNQPQLLITNLDRLMSWPIRGLKLLAGILLGNYGLIPWITLRFSLSYRSLVMTILWESIPFQIWCLSSPGHVNSIRALASPGRGIEGQFAELERLDCTYLP